jgi:hypothetical protein
MIGINRLRLSSAHPASFSLIARRKGRDCNFAE